MIRCIVSACLAGYPCRYDGKSKPIPAIVDMVRRGEALPVCPEALGGLPCPRPPAEICAGTGTDVLAGNARVINAAGQDVTHQYIKGAQAAADLCTLYGVQQALLMPRSPSCGCGQIYNGTFTRTLIPGDGVAAALLKAQGIEVISWQQDK